MNFLKNVKKDVVLDQTTYGAIQSARWGAQDRNFLDQYSSGAALGVKNHCFGPWAQVSPASQKKVAEKAPNLNSNGDGSGGCPRGRGNRGDHGLSQLWPWGTHLHTTKTKKFINVTHKEKPQWPSSCANVVLLPCLVPLFPCH